MLIRVTKTKLTLKPPQNAPLCTGKVKETPEHFLLNCKKNMTQRTKLEKNINKRNLKKQLP